MRQGGGWDNKEGRWDKGEIRQGQDEDDMNNEIKMRQRLDEDETNTRRRRDEDEMKTRWRRDEDETETRKDKDQTKRR